MSEPTYRQALFQAWRLVWHNKILWIFGLLSMLFAGSFGADNFIGKLLTALSDGKATFLANFKLRSFLNFTPINAIGLVWLAGIMIAIGLFIIFVSICSRASLLIATAEFYRHKIIPKFSLIWHSSIKYFWQILSIEMIKKILLITILIIFTAIWQQLPNLNSLWQTPLAFLILGVIICLSLIIISVAIYASGYAVIDKKSLLTSITSGWKLFRRHILVSLEISLILLLIDLLVLFLLLGVFSVAFVPSLLIWIVAATVGNYVMATIGFLLGLFILVILIAFVGAIYNTFTTSVWMYMFMKMHHENIFSRIFHHVGNFFKK
ncbi:MAG: hypothetical protein COU29_01240 [Candidatus Magasanikbacteria bacterium CG10_big_fil_rev_8_21_14_0_10_36_32]|uniref:Glycerophosphoryl diester phosphodiesterase membrane domain-containing protein n=1 Tax=Candidatus Magasanikbacteria bacterium CG10_big_fil_rev_8_21_14_0_10_36_32 TaxID=1974646 RepID=A0A2M6W6J5_9BACT|nr:MAG: hypothetical protein COU29_01240 [Candidatus Magasanikbacteria bacterium CG10_big_fil_rev_8_21_14_0_10_36_32]